MSKKKILIISGAVLAAVLIVLGCVFIKNASENTGKTEVVSEIDDGNWTSIYEAGSVD